MGEKGRERGAMRGEVEEGKRERYDILTHTHAHTTHHAPHTNPDSK